MVPFRPAQIALFMAVESANEKQVQELMVTS